MTSLLRAGRRHGFDCVTALLGLAALAGCSSPPSSFYTLGSNDAPSTAHGAAAPALLIELAPVAVPPQIARTAFVVQTSANRVDVLEQTRWASLPADEIRHALSQDLTQRLGTLDVSGSPHPDSVPVYRVSISVQRFESWPGSHTLIDAVWSVRALHSQTALTCRSVVSQPVASGNDALVAGHRLALDRVAAKIAAGIEALGAAPEVHVASRASGESTGHGVRRLTNMPCPAE